MENMEDRSKQKDYWREYLSTEKKQMAWEIFRMSWPNVLSLLIM